MVVQEDKMCDLGQIIEDLQGRVEAIASGKTDGHYQTVPANSAASEEIRRNRLTLVLAGFPKDTRKSEILDKIEAVLTKLDLMRSKTDADALTTRPRSTFALLRFEARKNESRSHAPRHE